MTELHDPTLPVEQIPAEQIDAPLEEEAAPISEAEAEPTPEAEAEPTPEVEPAPTHEEELETLRREVEQLRASLAEREQEQQRTMREIGEFHHLFPDVSLEEIPEGVWNSVQSGIPLSAAYALYEKKQRRTESRAEEINRKNAARSAGRAGKHTAGEYFSPDEVRAMSQRQVHTNYRAIMDSMKHWH